MNQLVFYFIFVITFSCFSSNISGQIIIEDPIVDVSTEWANHQIDSFHFSAHGTFAFINDGSIWRINPNDINWISENQEYLTHIAITIMPEAGSDHYPVRFIVHNNTSYGWKDFTVSQESAPTLPERAVISEIKIDDEIEGNLTIKIQKISNEDLIESSLFINPLDVNTVCNWNVGHRIVIGGVWFPEYDPVGRKEYNCTFLFTIYNYETKEFAFFAL